MKNTYIFKKLVHTMMNGVKQNWHERNGGNISWLLTNEEVDSIKHNFVEGEVYPLDVKVPALQDQYIIVSASGKFFGNVEIDFEEVLGVIKIVEGGTSYQILWGFANDSRPTSELPTHLLMLNQNAELGNGNKVVYHCHPANTNILSFIMDHDHYEITAELWKMASESPVVIPKGVGILKWMVPGSREIGLESIKLIQEFDAVIWAHHGIFATSDTLDNTFGMIHVIEKSAETAVAIRASKETVKSAIKKDEVVSIAKAFGVELNQKAVDKL